MSKNFMYGTLLKVTGCKQFLLHFIKLNVGTINPNNTLQTNQYTTDQTVHYRPNSTYVLYLFMPFSWIHALLFHKSREREDGVGGWGLTGTRIDMSSFYLPNEFFFSSELRRHSEKTLHYRLSPLADANV